MPVQLLFHSSRAWVRHNDAISHHQRRFIVERHRSVIDVEGTAWHPGSRCCQDIKEPSSLGPKQQVGLTFFKTPGTERLYSGLASMRPSAGRDPLFKRLTGSV